MKSLFLSAVVILTSPFTFACDGDLVLTDMGENRKAQLIQTGEVYDCSSVWADASVLACRHQQKTSETMWVALDAEMKNFRSVDPQGKERCSGETTTINKVSALSYKTCMSLRGGLTPMPNTVTLNSDYSCGPIPRSDGWSVCQAENPGANNSFVIHSERLGSIITTGETPLESNAFVQYCN